jgi:D-3-phosphoglycerate dehydrogenase / 2-oxoglutarate reductase
LKGLHLPYVPKVVITDFQFPNIAVEAGIVKSAGGELFAFQCRTEDEVIANACDADALLVQWAPITQSVIERLPHCKVIVRYGVGLDNVDVTAARKRGIAVRNIPDYCIDEVADHTFALAMSLARQLPTIDRQIRQGVWRIVPPRPMQASRQLWFATIGCGRIARAVLSRARACKYNLAVCDPYLPADADLPEGALKMTLEELLRCGDILSLHLPLSNESRHLINADSLSKMKPSALLLNTARGELIDTVALAAALDKGQIAGAGLDVFEKEPLEEDHPLRKCRNVILTSHVSWYSELSGPTLQRMAAEEAVRHFQTR